MPGSNRRQRGFTLLEVMVAVTVFAAVALAINETTSQSVSSALYLQDKTLAAMIADNQLTELRLKGLPPLGEQRQPLPFANREWLVHTRVEKTDFPDTHRVTVSVADHQHKDSPLISLATIMGKH